MKPRGRDSAPFHCAPGAAWELAPSESPQCPPGSGWGRAPAWEAEMGNSDCTAQSSLEIFSYLAFFYFFPTGKQIQIAAGSGGGGGGCLKLLSLSPAQRGRGGRPPF